MVEKLNQFLFSKVNSSYSQDELSILINKFYNQHKSNKGHEKYLVENDFKSFANNFLRNLTEQQKSDLEKLTIPRKGLFNTLFHAIFGFNILVNKYKNNEEGQAFLVRFHIFSEIQKKLYNSVLNKNKMDIIKFSQTDIANEFDVDKKTLAKWLELLNLKDKYFGRKQLSFYEYNDIFKKLFTESNEDFDLKNKFESYNIRLNEKKTLSKKDIIRLGFDLSDKPKTIDYDRAKEIIQENNDFDFYNTIDKYPYAIAIKIINYLKLNS